MSIIMKQLIHIEGIDQGAEFGNLSIFFKIILGLSHKYERKHSLNRLISHTAY